MAVRTCSTDMELQGHKQPELSSSHPPGIAQGHASHRWLLLCPSRAGSFLGDAGLLPAGLPWTAQLLEPLCPLAPHLLAPRSELRGGVRALPDSAGPLPSFSHRVSLAKL